MCFEIAVVVESRYPKKATEVDGRPRKLRWSASSMEPLIHNVFYEEFSAERQEILCHKWIESEKAGYDIGFERALIDWTLKYRAAWLEKRLVFIRSPLLPLTPKQPPSPSRPTTPPLRLVIPNRTVDAED